jgi:hypothetical protein
VKLHLRCKPAHVDLQIYVYIQITTICSQVNSSNLDGLYCICDLFCSYNKYITRTPCFGIFMLSEVHCGMSTYYLSSLNIACSVDKYCNLCQETALQFWATKQALIQEHSEISVQWIGKHISLIIFLTQKTTLYLEEKEC